MTEQLLSGYITREHEVLRIGPVKRGRPTRSSIPLPEATLLCAAGIVVSGNGVSEYSLDSRPPAATLYEALAWTGEWFGVFVGKSATQGQPSPLVVAADYFGYSQLFYAIVDDERGRADVLISPSFRGVLGELRRAGISPGLRLDVAAPSLVTSHNYFRTRSSRQSFAEGVSVLGHDEILVFTGDRLDIVTRPKLFEGLEYNQLLESGISRAGGLIRQMVESGAPVSMGLSGGKDSRALLALAMAGGVERGIGYASNRPGPIRNASREILARDYETAARICQRFGLERHAGTAVARYPIDFAEDLAYWQDYRSNSSFEFLSHQGLEVPVERYHLLGIGGELVRSYIGAPYRMTYSSWWQAANKDAEGRRKDLAALFPRLCSNWLLAPDLFESMTESYVNSLDLDPQLDAIGQIDLAYREYRNRCHAGSGRFTRQAGAIQPYPLALPEFVAAAEQLPSEEREGGKLLFDIMETVCPDLNALPFVSPPWPESFKSSGSESSWERYDGRDWIDSPPTRVANYPAPVDLRRMMSIADSRRPFRDDAMERIAESVELLRDVSGEPAEGVTQRMARLVQINDGTLRSVLGASETIRDVLGEGAGHTSIRRHDWELGGVASRPSATSSIDRTGFIEIVREIDLSGVEAELSFHSAEEGTLVSVAIARRPALSTVAVDFYVNGVREGKIGYESSDLVEFLVPMQFAESTYVRAEVFLKWQGDPQAQRLIYLSN